MPKRKRTEFELELEDDNCVPVVNPGEPTTVNHAEGMVDETPPAASERLWFSDGTVVLQAEGVQFKVYQAILAQRSPVLAAIFGAIQPGNEDVVDGCPVVQLEEDSAEDVKHMLLALYGDPDEGLVRLKLEFPEKLNDFDKTPKSFPRTHIKCVSADEQANMEIEAINLAHECGIQTILPALYFQVVLKMTNLLNGKVEVPKDIVYKLVAGRDKLMSARSKRVFQWVYDVGEMTGCVAKKKCSAISHLLLKKLFKTPIESVGTVLLPWDAFTKEMRVPLGTNGPNDLCVHCHVYAKASHSDGRRAVWAALPTCFGLPAWAHLEDFESESQGEDEGDF